MAGTERPAKRAKLLSDSEESEDETPNGEAGFRVNEEFAKRFEHNKKREEKQRLEEKYANPKSRSNGRGMKEASDEDESSSDESEDDDGDLATMDVDEEIFETLRAIREKDPRVYDTNVKFYRDFEVDGDGEKEAEKGEKPMYLSDYHRRNLLDGHTGDEVEEEEELEWVKTYGEEQDRTRDELLRAAHANGTTSETLNASDNEDDLVEFAAKSKPKAQSSSNSFPTLTRPITEQDIAIADKDPESYLSNFLAARAWIPADGPTSRFTALDSDDSEDERRAEKFEEAYNLRFEDPATANETLRTFGRDVGQYGVRRDEKTGRKRAREREREQKEQARREREEERARLRKLKIEEAEEKVRRIKDAAGLRGKEVEVEEWRGVLEGDFEGEEWDREMERRFGEGYYGEKEEESDGGLHKPNWEDDIDIGDLVPEFDREEKQKTFTLSSDDEDDGGVPVPLEQLDSSGGEAESQLPSKKPKKSKKDRGKDKREAKRQARLERRAIEDLVDTQLPLSHPTLTPSAPLPSKLSSSTFKASSPAGPARGFQYRDTSPTSFGLSTRDILFADDSQLNQFVGLKKMAAFRDEEKKRKDRKKYSKKGRLREWRKETFGDVREPKGGFERVVGGAGLSGANAENFGGGAEARSGKRKRQRKEKGAEKMEV